MEGRARAGRALGRDVAAHQLGEPAHDREAEPGAAEAARGRGIRLRERLEQALAALLVDADAGIGDREAHRGAAAADRRRRGAHRDAAVLGEFQRIAEKIEQDLPHARRVADQRVVRAGLDRAGQHQALRGRLRLERAHHAVDQAGEREDRGLELEPAGLDLGEVEHVVDDAQQRVRRVAHRRDGAALRRIEPLPVEHLHHAEHAVHRRADLVAHGGEEGRLRLVGGLRLGALALGGERRGFGRRGRLSAASLAAACASSRSFSCGDVAIDPEQAAVGERLVGELDVAPAPGLPLVAEAAGRAHHVGALAHHLLDVVGRAEVAAQRLVADDVVAGRAGLGDLGRDLEELVELLVAEFPVEVLVDQHDPVVHVLQHGAHVLARRLDLGARRRKLQLALHLVGDVDGRADHAVGDAVGIALRDAALARPAPLSLIVEIAVFGKRSAGSRPSDARPAPCGRPAGRRHGSGWSTPRA